MGVPSVGEWRGVLSGLAEVLESVLDRIDEDQQARISPDITCLEALDSLNRYLEAIKQDMGV